MTFRSSLLATASILAIIASGCVARTSATVREPSQFRVRTPSPLFDPTHAEALLEAPDRNRWQKPAEIVRALKLKSGMTVADVGAGSGYLLPYLSQAVGPSGRVYAEEIQDDFLPRLRERAAGLKNVQVIKGTAIDPRLPPDKIDCFVLLTVYHEVERPIQFLEMLKQYARPHARFAIIDFDITRRGDPPAPLGHELPESDVIAEARAAGWTLIEKHQFLSSQFFLIFKPSDRSDPSDKSDIPQP